MYYYEIIHTKQFTKAQKLEFNNIMNQSLLDAKADTMNCQWLGLMVDGILRSAIVYKHMRRQGLVYLISLATHPDHRCQGFATDLLDFFIANVNQATKKEVWFFCDPERVGFYKNRGAVTMKKKYFKRKIQVRVQGACVAMRFP